jgi:hypothetical protein
MEGVGIYCENSDPIISENVIGWNSAGEVDQAASGGGIYCRESNPVIIYNDFIGNHVGDEPFTSGGTGGGIFCFDCNAEIANNLFFENEAIDVGGGIFCWRCDSTVIYGNVFIENFAFAAGGAICLMLESPIVVNNTIVSNTAIGQAGGIYCQDQLIPVIITNCILWDNSLDQIEGDSLNVSYCNIQGGWPGEGNIDCDPMFCYPDTGNYYLDHLSCCLGAGQGGVDIGAFGIGCYCGDTNRDSLVTASDGYLLLNFLGSMQSEPFTCWSANTNGDDILTPSDGFRILNYLGDGPDLNCQPCEFLSLGNIRR